jgi:hypothetical protein
MYLSIFSHSIKIICDVTNIYPSFNDINLPV